jgi:hypothetical protein
MVRIMRMGDLVVEGPFDLVDVGGGRTADSIFCATKPMAA